MQKDMGLADVIGHLDELAHVKEGLKGMGVYGTPNWNGGTIGLQFSFNGNDPDAMMLIRAFPPTAVLEQCGQRQAFYVIGRKYPEAKFYLDFMERLTDGLKSPNVHKRDFVLPGLGSKVVFANKQPLIEFEKTVDEHYAEWKRGMNNVLIPLPERLEYGAAIDSLNKEAIGRFAAFLDKGRSTPPEWIKEIGDRCLQYGFGMAETARMLYYSGAYPREVYAYLREYGKFDCEYGERGEKAARLAAEMVPAEVARNNGPICRPTGDFRDIGSVETPRHRWFRKMDASNDIVNSMIADSLDSGRISAQRREDRTLPRLRSARQCDNYVI